MLGKTRKGSVASGGKAEFVCRMHWGRLIFLLYRKLADPAKGIAVKMAFHDVNQA